MKPETIFRLWKAGIFILAIIIYRAISGILITALFALILGLYLMELYKRKKDE